MRVQAAKVFYGLMDGLQGFIFIMLNVLTGKAEHLPAIATMLVVALSVMLKGPRHCMVFLTLTFHINIAMPAEYPQNPGHR